MTRVQVYELQDKIGQILIPTEDVVEMKAGKKVVTSKLFFLDTFWWKCRWVTRPGIWSEIHRK